MKKIGIVTDSHSGISHKEAEKLGIVVLPMPFYIEDKCYYEEVSITREDFFEQLNSGKKVTTSQPSPDEVMNLWRKCLEEYENILYIPMSSGLSGSCNTAMMLAMDEEFEGKVYVVDNGRISTPLHRSILDAIELTEEGYSAEEIKNILESSKEEMVIYLGVETLEYLKKGGRITPATAAIGNMLNIKPVLKFDVGVLETYRKCRGMHKVRKEMLEAIKNDFETTYKEQYENGDVYLLAASSADEVTTQDWISQIQECFPEMEILCDNLSLGISCHTGEGALGVGLSCKPKGK
ncbi:MAG: DegV family protein [Lachnospiraceae bacterium]|nr:DegV family protein [Lachnospiraceae bacterium]MBQ4068334.1 DegV family protein [Lachnospiraceae bacterium]